MNSVSFHSNGCYLASASADATVKIWDLRKGQIMYTIYGHEGPTLCAEFSPLGDYLLTGGQDSNIVIWKTNLNERCTEILHGISAAKVDTDIFVTDKTLVKKLPSDPKPKFAITQKKKENIQTQNTGGKSINVADQRVPDGIYGGKPLLAEKRVPDGIHGGKPLLAG